MEKEEERQEKLLGLSFDERYKLATTGTNTDRDTLINDEIYIIREAIAEYGNDSHRDILINDENPVVRATIAKYGNNKHRNFLLNDKEPQVKEIIAIFGTDKHRDTLVHDPNWGVRQYVAKNANKEHLSILFGDKNIFVQKAVWKRMYELNLEVSDLNLKNKIHFANKIIDSSAGTFTDLNTGKSGKLSISPGVDLKSSNRTEIEKLLQGKNAVLKHTNGQDIKCQLIINPGGYSLNLCKESSSHTSAGMEL